MRDRGSLEWGAAYGRRLTREAYDQEFAEREEQIRGRDSWKFERLQYFDEQGDPSREMFRRGEWEEALRLLEAEREIWQGIAREDEERGSLFHRLRVVETPLTPYLQWELQALRIQAECGMRIRVICADVLEAMETAGVLPEVVTLGGRTLYQVIYADSGVLDGAIRFTEPALIANWEGYIKELYEAGQDILSYFDRHVAHLPPPRPTLG